MTKRRSSGTRRGSADRPPGALVEIDRQEAELLVRLATHYQRSMGPMRFLVRLTAPAEIKSKYRFVAEESKWLKRFAEATRSRMKADGAEYADVSFTVSALIAFWGRLLSSLTGRRSRRLSQEQVQRRETLAAKLEEAVLALQRSSPDAVEQALRTRRPQEEEWMRGRLAAPSHEP